MSLQFFALNLPLILEVGFGFDDKLESTRVLWTLKINSVLGSRKAMSNGMLHMVTYFAMSSSSKFDVHSFFGDFGGFFFSSGPASFISTPSTATSIGDFERLFFYSGNIDVIAVIALANISNEFDKHCSTYFLLWFHVHIVVM